MDKRSLVSCVDCYEIWADFRLDKNGKCPTCRDGTSEPYDVERDLEALERRDLTLEGEE